MVFLKGCPLRCQWCCNPESLLPEPQAWCDTGEIIGWQTTVEELMHTVARDRHYYRHSGGGITLSGGEPTAQPEFCLAILKEAKRMGIHTAIETSGHAPSHEIEKIAEYTDVFLFDFKLSSAGQHIKYTGTDNTLILHNLSRLGAWQKDIILRCIIVPGINDNEAHFKSIASLTGKIPGIGKIELMPYHSLGAHKYMRLNMNYPLASSPAINSEQCRKWKIQIEKYSNKKIQVDIMT